MVPGEHFVLKDLSFYEEAREAHAKARQERLEQQEEKRQKGKLKKAPDQKSCGPSSRARPPPKNKKKKTIAKAIKVASPTLESSFTSTASTSNRSTSSAQASEGESSSSMLDTIDPRIGPSQPGS